MKTHIKQFIEDAIAGRWKESEIERCTTHFIHENANDGAENCFVIDNSFTCSVDGERHNIAKHYSIGDILLDPLAWQAVGKTRGWNLTDRQTGAWRTVEDHYARYLVLYENTPVMHMHDFIERLAEGKSIEEALEYIK